VVIVTSVRGDKIAREVLLEESAEEHVLKNDYTLRYSFSVLREL
jgi:hypothetical protein